MMKKGIDQLLSDDAICMKRVCAERSATVCLSSGDIDGEGIEP